MSQLIKLQFWSLSIAQNIQQLIYLDSARPA